MKKSSIYVSILIFCGLAVFGAVFSPCLFKADKRREPAETILEKSFASSGARVVSSSIYLRGALPDRYTDAGGLKELASSLAADFKVLKGGSRSESIIDNDFIKKAELNGNSQEYGIVSINAQLNGDFKNTGDRTVTVGFTQELSCSGLEKIRRDALAVLKKYDIYPKVNSCITGSFEGRLDPKGTDEVLAKVFKETGARRVEGMNDGGLTSVSAYSPFIGDFIRAGGEKINLNAALRYNKNEDRTYIWLAVPVITTEY